MKIVTADVKMDRNAHVMANAIADVKKKRANVTSMKKNMNAIASIKEKINTSTSMNVSAKNVKKMRLDNIWRWLNVFRQILIIIEKELQNNLIIKNKKEKEKIIVNGNKVASIGVFGPQKMDYMGIASALKVLVDELNKKKGE